MLSTLAVISDDGTRAAMPPGSHNYTCIGVYDVNIAAEHKTSHDKIFTGMSV